MKINENQKVTLTIGQLKRLIKESEYMLKPRYDSRASFYNKARVEVNYDGTEILYSYDTPVAKCSPDGKCEVLPDWNYSQTTRRHVHEFLRQHGDEQWPPRED